MAILKKDSHKESRVKEVSLKTLCLNEEGVDISGDYEFENKKAAVSDKTYEELRTEATEIGFQEGYKKGLDKADKERLAILDSLEKDKENAQEFIDNLACQSISNLNKDMSKLVITAIEKIFISTVDNDEVMKTYLVDLVLYLTSKFKDFTISCNSKSESIIWDNIKSSGFTCVVDDSLSDYDIRVEKGVETTEYYLKCQFDKVREIFE